MSVRMMSQVWELDVSQSWAWVLMAYADWADDDGRCWPSAEHVGYKTGFSKRQIQRIRRELIDAGIMVVEYNVRGGTFTDTNGKRRGAPTHIRLDFSHVAKKPPFGRGDKMTPLFGGDGDDDDTRDDFKTASDDVAVSPDTSVNPSEDTSVFCPAGDEFDDPESLPISPDIIAAIAVPAATVPASPPTPIKRPSTMQQLVTDAIGKVCGIDIKVRANARYCGRIAANLIAANYTAEHILNFGLWWDSDAWRKEHKGRPKPYEVQTLIAQGAHYVPGQVPAANGNGARASPPERPDPPAQRKLEELRRQKPGGVREA